MSEQIMGVPWIYKGGTVTYFRTPQVRWLKLMLFCEYQRLAMNNTNAMQECSRYRDYPEI